MNNYSKQREIMLDVFKKLHHPTAEEIYNEVHKKNPVISKSTVYRNLNVLLKNHIINKIKVLTGPDRFDLIEKKHYHVICKNCDDIFDFIYPFEQNELKKSIQKQTGVTIIINSVTLYGICKKCSVSKNKEE